MLRRDVDGGSGPEDDDDDDDGLIHFISFHSLNLRGDRDRDSARSL